MKYIRLFPTLLIPAIIYMLIAAAAGNNMPHALAGVIVKMPMPSGAPWEMSLGQLVLMISTVLLFIETLKSSYPSNEQMVETLLSVGVFILCFMLFLLARPFGTSEFFIITLMSLLDFLAAAFIMTRVAQRTVQYER